MATPGRVALSTYEDIWFRVLREKSSGRVATPLLRGAPGEINMTTATQGGGTFF
jgi:hypothetical protein